MHKIDLYLLTGFLGAGKTTFLKAMLEQAGDKKVGIIMNEFGKVGIDGDLVKDKANELIEINRGSIFCSCLQLSFVESLKDMSEKPIDALFVEGSGLADPSNIGEILEATEVLIGEKYRYAGSICIIDAVNFIDQAKDSETLERQIKHSHLAVISKTDIEDKFDLVKSEVLKHNAEIEIEKADMGKLPFNFFEKFTNEAAIIKDETTNKVENKPKTLSLELHEPVEKERLEVFLKTLSADAFRMKGFVELTSGDKVQVDVVNGKIDYQTDTENHDSSIVIISKIGPQIIKKIIPLWDSKVQTAFKLRN
ncbi:GTP-binding protein [Acidaminobacter sp. JC074]|uniref:CobW family GTP-binding protein n=1 Tax=Acidaminobacter sp. JC074 TaxID=2530199 RepID=UPI001F0F01B7|nr:CobW family GTP-binding protein [Acidaminobacter sp. JC074]MCH4888092.1 GTP-binding protein [Acidaminobacter sp. JC074]